MSSWDSALNSLLLFVLFVLPHQKVANLYINVNDFKKTACGRRSVSDNFDTREKIYLEVPVYMSSLLSMGSCEPSWPPVTLPSTGLFERVLLCRPGSLNTMGLPTLAPRAELTVRANEPHFRAELPKVIPLRPVFIMAWLCKWYVRVYVHRC